MPHVTFFGTYSTRTTPRVQVLIEGLKANGVTVVECNAPLALGTKERVAILQQPWRLPILVAHLGWCWLQLIFKRTRLTKTDAVLVGHLGQFDVRLARLLFRRKPIILDYMISGADTAQDRRETGSWKQRLLKYIDRKALAAADHIIVDTPEHRENLPKGEQAKAVVVPVGATEQWFGSPSPKNHTLLKAIFFGAFTPLQGAAYIAEATQLLKRPLAVTMVGSGQDLAAAQSLAAADSVTWLDWVEPAELPGLVAQHDICLGIFGTSPKAQRVVPNKVYQGAAAGCAIVTSATTPQKRCLGDAAAYVAPGDAKALAKTLDQLSADPSEVIRLKQAAYQLADSSFRPAQVVQPLLSILLK